jgi:hypothetical protein
LPSLIGTAGAPEFMPSIAAAEAQLRADNRPVLFLDTCILLDAIRATYRCLGSGYVQRAVELRTLLTSNPPQCALVVASIVPTEWSDYAPKVRDEVRSHLMKIQDQAVHFHDACATLGIPLTFGRPFYPGVGLADGLYDLSKSLLDGSIRLDRDSGCESRGVGRVVAKKPPSKQGGEVKDCVIVEECLELTRQLRANGFARKCVFSTSNMNDYGGPGGGLHPILAAEFAMVSLAFTADLPWAIHELQT